jgi:hypothetical protein
LCDYFAPRARIACLLNFNEHWDTVSIQKQMVERPALGSFSLVWDWLFPTN